MNLLNAIGRSDLYLKVDLSKFPFILFFLVAAIPYGVKAMIMGQVISAIIGFFINAYYPGKFYGYGAWAQIKDLSRMLLATLIMAIPVYFVCQSIDHHLLAILTGGSCGIFTYVAACHLLNVKELTEIKNIGLKLLYKGKNKGQPTDGDTTEDDSF
jgi:putative effector of murein hydrolase